MGVRAKPKPEPEPEKVYVATTSFASEHPVPHLVVRRGTRLKGDHPAVAAFFESFVEDGVPPSEWPRPAPREAPQEPPAFHRIAEAIPDEECAIAMFAYSKGSLGIAKGERRLWNDPVVQADRGLWKMAPLPVPAV